MEKWLLKVVFTNTPVLQYSNLLEFHWMLILGRQLLKNPAVVVKYRSLAIGRFGLRAAGLHRYC